MPCIINIFNFMSILLSGMMVEEITELSCRIRLPVWRAAGVLKK